MDGAFACTAAIYSERGDQERESRECEGSRELIQEHFSCAYVNNQQGSRLGMFKDVGISVL